MFNAANTSNDINHWRKFVHDFYSTTGTLRQQLVNIKQNEPKQFEIPNNLLARYYFTLFESGVQNVQLVIEQAREAVRQQGPCVECQKATFIYWFENGIHVGALKFGYVMVPANVNASHSL